MYISLCVIVALFCYLCYRGFRTYVRVYRHYFKVPGFRSFPLLGSLPYICTDPYLFWTQLLGSCHLAWAGSPTVNPDRTRICRVWVGPEPVIVLFGADEVEALLSSNRNIKKAFHYNFLHPWLGRGLLTSGGSRWRRKRKLLTPTFHYGILKQFIPGFNEHCQILINKLQRHAMFKCQPGENDDIMTNGSINGVANGHVTCCSCRQGTCKECQAKKHQSVLQNGDSVKTFEIRSKRLDQNKKGYQKANNRVSTSINGKVNEHIVTKHVKMNVPKSHTDGGFNIYPYLTRCTLDIICVSAMGCTANAQMHADEYEYENFNYNSLEDKKSVNKLCGNGDREAINDATKRQRLGDKSNNQERRAEVEYVKSIYKLSDLINDRQRRPHLWPNFIFRFSEHGREHAKCLNIIHGFTRDVIQRRMTERDGGSASTFSGDKPAFLDLVLDLHQHGEMSIQDVQEEVDTFMFEGHDTTAASLAWTTQLIGQHQDVQEQIYAELCSVLGPDPERHLSYSDICLLPYLEAVVKESLRLYPSVPLMARQLVEPLTVKGHVLERGRNVLMLPYLVHRDPVHWPDPERFDPNRFLTPDFSASDMLQGSADNGTFTGIEQCPVPPSAGFKSGQANGTNKFDMNGAGNPPLKGKKGRHPYAYIPFSAGARNCIGQRFALLELKCVMAWLVRSFKITSLRRRDQVEETAELILRSSDGVWVTLEKRA